MELLTANICSGRLWFVVKMKNTVIYDEYCSKFKKSLHHLTLWRKPKSQKIELLSQCKIHWCELCELSISNLHPWLDNFIKWKHFLHYWPFVWDSTGHQSTHKGQWHAVLMLLFNVSEQMFEQTVEALMIWDAMISMWCHCNWDRGRCNIAVPVLLGRRVS